jgi:hypothetical protein
LNANAWLKEGNNVANSKAFTPAQIEKFERGAAHYEQRWLLELDKSTTLEEVFAAGYFKLFARKLEKNAIIRVVSADASIDFDLTVVAKRGDDITVKLRPRIAQAVIDAAAAAGRPQAPLAAIAAA